MKIETATDAAGKPLGRLRIETLDGALAEIRRLEAQLALQVRTIRELSNALDRDPVVSERGAEAAA